MDFRYSGIRAQIHQDNLYRTPSPSNYTSFSQGGLWSGRSVGGGQGGSELLRELEKKRIREEILAEEAERKRCLEADLRREYEREMRGVQSGGGFLPSSSLMLRHPDSHHPFQPQILHGQSYNPVDTRIPLPYQEDYGGRIRRQPGEHVGLDVVPIQRSPKSKEISTSPPKAGDKGFIGFVSKATQHHQGKSHYNQGTSSGPTVSGFKRKPPSPAGGATTEIFSRSKKKLTEWSCEICEVSATSERGLQDHLAGKKHQAKVAERKGDHTGKTETCKIKNSPEGLQIVSCEDKKPEGESSGLKYKFWCRMCKFGAPNKKEMNMHKKGIKHLQNQLNHARKSRGKAGGGSERI